MLPPAYELIPVDRVDSVIEEAVRRARQGAGEGVIVWALEQSDAKTRSGKQWESPQGNLHCALIIEPEFDNATAAQLLYVAAISAGTAIADILSPMTGLRYRWPNHIYINDLKSGLLQIATPDGDADPYPWLVLGLSVNVAHHPPNPEPERFNSMHASGTPEANVGELLEAYCRHFLSWVNRWAEEGFGPVHKTWLQRADGVGGDIRLRVDDEIIEGRFGKLDSQGRINVELADGGHRCISVGEYFALGRFDAG
jgi:BirA family biotin operon repressor/biotin-[acetyl-CoA-carboxylase] ligase